VGDRVLLLNKGCLSAVLEVVAAMLAHERVADATEVDPQVRKLMCEQRAGVEQLAAVDGFPLVSGTVRVVALRRKRVSRRAECEKVKQESLVVPLVAVRQGTRPRH